MFTPFTKIQLAQFFESRAAEAEIWRQRNRYYYDWISRWLRFSVPDGSKVLEVGSGLGDLLAATGPEQGLGVDFSPAMVALARQRHPSANLRFLVGDIELSPLVRETFDAVIASDLVGYLDDIQTALENMRVLCHAKTRLYLTQYSRVWEPVLHLGARLKLNQPKPLNNWLAIGQLEHLLRLAGFDVITRGTTFLCPKRLWGLGDVINRTVGHWPGIRRAGLVQYLVARPTPAGSVGRFSVSVAIPFVHGSALEEIVRRVPSLGSRTEIILTPARLDGGSGVTQESVTQGLTTQRVVRMLPPAATIAGAVAQAAAAATGSLFFVLPEDGVAPEELPKFYRILASGQADVVVGSRLVYPSRAVPTWRRAAIAGSAAVLANVIGQRLSDAGSPVIGLGRTDFIDLAGHQQNSAGAGNLGLLLGAARRGYKLAEIPVHYQPAQTAPEAAHLTVPGFAAWRQARRSVRW